MAMKKSHCIPVDERLDSIIQEIENITITGLEAEAGCGILITPGSPAVFSVVTDGTTIECVDGELRVITTGAGIAVQEFGIEITANTNIINFYGDVEVTDDPGNSRTNITLTGGAAQDTIEILNEGSSLGDFFELDFIGSGVTATDAGGGRANITVPGGGSGGGGGWIKGTLDADLGSETASVNVSVDHYQGADPGATLSVNNMPSTVIDATYLFVGKTDCNCMAYQAQNSNWYFAWIEPPSERPDP